MPKNSGPPPSGRSRIRAFFIDADLAPGDMQELTAALTNAMRPTHVISRTTNTARLGRGGDGSDAVEGIDDVEVQEADVVDDGADEPGVVASKPAGKPRKYRSPKLVEMNMDGDGTPFAAFAAAKGNPDDHQTRFLIAAYWLAQHAGVATASVDHVYTCYQAADWRFDIQDPAFPFRRLGKKYGETKDAKFTIGHIGRSAVEKMKPVGEA